MTKQVSEIWPRLECDMQLVFRDSVEVARLLDAHQYIDRAAVGHCLVCLARQGLIHGIEG